MEKVDHIGIAVRNIEDSLALLHGNIGVKTITY